MSTATQARRTRATAAAKYKPERVKLLLIAEAPPVAPDRYFYFEEVPHQDSLFRHVVRTVLGVEPARGKKGNDLRRLADRGVFLIDLKLDPREQGERLDPYVPDLVQRATVLKPRHRPNAMRSWGHIGDTVPICFGPRLVESAY